MKNRWFLTLIAALLVAVLVACGGPSEPTPPGTHDPLDPNLEYLTFEESVDAVQSVMNDAVSIGNGFVDSDLDKAVEHVTGLPIPRADMVATIVPGFYVLFYDVDAELKMSNWRLATGTFDYAPYSPTDDWTYSTSPDDALVLTWSDESRGSAKQMELRIEWGAKTTVNTYGDPTLAERETFEAPNAATVTLKQDGATLAGLEITQQWVSTTECGFLAEASYLKVEGSLGTVAGGATVRQLTFDHTTPGTVKLSGDLDARAGSLALPISFEVSASAHITRDDACQIESVSGPLDANLELKVGKGNTLAQLRFDVGFEPDNLDNWDTGDLTVSDGRFVFGSKRFDFAGGLALPSDDLDGLPKAIMLTFAGDATNTLLEFLNRFDD